VLWEVRKHRSLQLLVDEWEKQEKLPYQLNWGLVDNLEQVNHMLLPVESTDVVVRHQILEEEL
jgi:hypothetical protein